jgi:hypothetical protein
MCLTEISSAMGGFSGIHVDTKTKSNVIILERDAFSTETIDDVSTLTPAGQLEFLKITTSFANMNMLTPNKEFIVNIDSPSAKKINGKYRISSFEMILVPSGEFLSPQFTIKLRR